MSFDDLLAHVDDQARAVLGRTVTYTPGVGDALELPGIFDAAFRVVDSGTPGVVMSAPAVFLKVEDLPAGYESDDEARVTVGAVEYLVRTVQADGVGGVVLILHEV